MANVDMADAANVSETEGIAGIYAAGGGDLSILHLCDTLTRDDLAAMEVADTGEDRMKIANAGTAVLPLDANSWAKILAPNGTSGDALPMNVPAHWDWAQRSVMHAGNNVPRGFAMQIGWGHLLNAADSGNQAQQSIELRNHQTLVCSRVNGQARWATSQRGGVQGAAFRADFAANANQPARLTYMAGNVLRANHPRGMAFHFWSNAGRQPIPGGYCGMLVLAEARAVQANGQPLASNMKPGLLLALGADYWLNKSIGWANQTTNRSVGVARLRRVNAQWEWHGFRTASDADVQVLRRNGAQ